MGNYSENYALQAYVESSDKDVADKLDALTHRIEVCRKRMEDLDERVALIEKQISQKFITEDEGNEQIQELDQKRSTLNDKMDELRDAIIALSTANND